MRILHISDLHIGKEEALQLRRKSLIGAAGRRSFVPAFPLPVWDEFLFELPLLLGRETGWIEMLICLLYTSPSPRDS